MDITYGKMKALKHHFVQIEAEGFPACPVGLLDAVDMIGTTPKTIRKCFREGECVYGIPVRDVGFYEVECGRKCIRCGAVIDNVRCTVYCDDCRVDNKNEELKRMRSRGTPQRVPPYQYKREKKRHEVPYEKKSDLARMAYDAQQAGMTYGQYMTYLNARWFT